MANKHNNQNQNNVKRESSDDDNGYDNDNDGTEEVGFFLYWLLHFFLHFPRNVFLLGFYFFPIKYFSLITSK